MKHLLITTIAAVVLVGCGDDVRMNTNDLVIEGNAKLSFSTKYRDGKMLIKFKVYPYYGTVFKTLEKQPANLADKAAISLIFKDKDGFEVFEQNFKLKDMRKFGVPSDNDGGYLEIDIQKRISEKDFNLITQYTLGRDGFVE